MGGKKKRGGNNGKKTQNRKDRQHQELQVDLQSKTTNKSDVCSLNSQTLHDDIPLNGNSVCPTDKCFTSQSIPSSESSGQQLPKTAEVNKTTELVKCEGQMSAKNVLPNVQLCAAKPEDTVKFNELSKSMSPETQKPGELCDSGQKVALPKARNSPELSKNEMCDLFLPSFLSADYSCSELSDADIPSSQTSPEAQKPGELCDSGQKEAVPKARNSPELSKNEMCDLFLPSFLSADYSCSELSDADIPSSQTSPVDVTDLEKQLSKYLSDGLLHTNQDVLDDCRRKLQLLYENIILADPVYCAENNVEESLWNSVYHQIIESLKTSIQNEPHRKEEFTQTLLKVVDEGTVFFENLLKKQEETHQFSLQKLSPVELLRTDDFCLPESIRVVLISCQKILIFLGDLAFYKEETRGTARYSTARSYYLKAHRIGPENGLPYYKLGVVSLQTRRKMDAFYYYMRSLAVNDPFVSAKDSLLSLFADAKKTMENSHKKGSVNITDNSETQSLSRSKRKRKKKQEKAKSQQTAQVVKDVNLEQLSAVELNKRFIRSFLDVHGKLFTGVGMETFADSVTQMLKEFQILLQCKPLAVGSSRLLQIMLSNMFAVHNTTPKDKSQDSVLQKHALNVTLAMVTLIMERCCSMYEDHLESREYPHQLVSSDLVQLLPAVKVWTNWMLCQKHLWVTAFLQNVEVQTGYTNCVWVSLGKLLTKLRMIDTLPVLEEMNGGVQLVLHEDASLLGFVPLNEASIKPAYVTSLGKINAENSLRIANIRAFGGYLCEFTNPNFRFNLLLEVLVCNKDSGHDKDSKHIKSTLSVEDTALSWVQEAESKRKQMFAVTSWCDQE